MTSDSIKRYRELVDRGYTQSIPVSMCDSIVEALGPPHAILGPGIPYRRFQYVSIWVKEWIVDIWFLLHETDLIADPTEACIEVVKQRSLAEYVSAHVEADRVARTLAPNDKAIEQIDRQNVRLVMIISGETGVEVKRGEEEWNPHDEKIYTPKT